MERKKYDAVNSKLKNEGRKPREEKSLPKEEKKIEPKEASYLLFTTKTCPNCKSAKLFLDKAKINYEVIDAEEQLDLTKKFNVMQAPTLIVRNGKDFNCYANASNIKAFTEGLN
ncbi:MAG: glutaredoxin domain-containing protein [Sphaerochaetaceae bacterium]|nr:glutaredoxin domain-containing protein [Sphaerochaetaceae bacterium]